MLDTYENQMRMRRNTMTAVSIGDIWKQMVRLDAIRSNRKIKTRISRYF